MDIFTEQLTKRPLKKTDYFLFFLICLFVVFAVWVSIAIFRFFSVLTVLASLYVAVKLIRSRFVEFEYVVTNGNLTIDKIVAKKSRKNIISFEISSVDKFFKFEKNLKIHGLSKIYNLQTTDELWCACFLDNNLGGKVAVVFSPDKKTLEAIAPFLRRQVAVDAFGRH